MASANRDSPEPESNTGSFRGPVTIHYEGRTITHQEYMDLLAHAHDEETRRTVGPHLRINHMGESMPYTEYMNRIIADRENVPGQQPPSQQPSTPQRETGARPKTRTRRAESPSRDTTDRLVLTREEIEMIQRNALDNLPAQQLGTAAATNAILSGRITLGDGSIFDPQLGSVHPPSINRPSDNSDDSDTEVVIEATIHNESLDGDDDDQMLNNAATLVEHPDHYHSLPTIQVQDDPTLGGAAASLPSLPHSDEEEEQDDADEDINYPAYADGNFLQQPIDGVPRIIREKVDASLVKRIIMITVMNGDPNTANPTIFRARELIDILFNVSGGTPKPLTSGFYVNLHTIEDRATSIARTAYLLPRAAAFRDIMPWLTCLPTLINGAVHGITLPTALALSDEELARFAAHHAPEFYDMAVASGEDLDLCRIVTEHLTMVYPLIYRDGDSDQAVPLYKLIFLGRDHIPPDYRTELFLQNIPEVIINNKVQLNPSCIVPHLQTYKKSNHALSLNEIKYRISQAFNTTGQPLNMIAAAFRHGQFLNYRGDDPAHLSPHDPDSQIIYVSVEEAPWQENDVYTVAIDRYGADWENIIRQQSNITRPVELTFPALDNLRSSRRVYKTRFRDVIFLIREWDPASLICDQHRTAEGRLTPRVLCVAPEDQRLPQMDGIIADWHGDFHVSRDHKELTWPGWESDTRRHGEYIRRLTPGSSRHNPVRVLRAGHTTWDLLIAMGDAIPFNFNRLSLHSNEIVYRPGQHICNPHDVHSYEYLPEQDRFIATGPSHAIPQAQVLPGQYMLLKRCGLCNWIYGRVVQCLPCGHLYCTVCLGLTSLVTVDKMVCLFCWTVPEKVRGKNPQSPPTITHYTINPLPF